MNALFASVNGRYAVRGNALDADCVIAQSFGAQEKSPGLVNERLAQFIVTNVSSELPLLAQGEIAQALPENFAPALVIEGAPSTRSGGQLDSSAVLQRCNEYMQENNLNRPLLVAQALHVGRVAVQAKKLGMSGLIVPEGLPREFDPDSLQKWTISQAEWVKRELPGMAYLAIAGKL